MSDPETRVMRSKRLARKTKEFDRKGLEKSKFVKDKRFAKKMIRKEEESIQEKRFEQTAMWVD